MSSRGFSCSKPLTNSTALINDATTSFISMPSAGTNCSIPFKSSKFKGHTVSGTSTDSDSGGGTGPSKSTP